MQATQQSAKEYLKREFHRRMEQNPHYSLRSFAQMLDLNPGELSEILRGKRRLSLTSAQKVIKNLGFTEKEKKQFLLNLSLEKTGIEFVENEADRQHHLNEKVFRLFSNWTTLHTLLLLDLKFHQWTPVWIAKKFGISTAEAKYNMDILEELGLITFDNRQNAKSCEEIIETHSEVPSLAIRKYHQAILQEASKAIENQKLNQRQMMGIGLAINKKDLIKIKKEVSDFLDLILRKYRKKKGDEIYYLETALFKLTKDEDSL